MLSRRTFLGLPLLGVISPGHVRAEGGAASRVTDVYKGVRGTTLTMELANAPFPAPGGAYRDPTVIVFVPRFFRADGAVQTVVHFHGYKNTADAAIKKHQLREQLFDGKQNAILIVPQLAHLAADIACGKLEHTGGFGRMVNDALTTAASSAKARAAMGDAALPRRPRVGTLCVSAHSGGFHAAAAAVKKGEIAINEAWLFDSLYGETETFREWVLAGRGKSRKRRHKLVSYYTGGATEQNTLALFAALKKESVNSALETVEGTLSRQQITAAQAVAIKTGTSHGGVTSHFNELRDCLFASSLDRSVRAKWFEDKVGARHLDERE